MDTDMADIKSLSNFSEAQPGVCFSVFDELPISF